MQKPPGLSDVSSRNSMRCTLILEGIMTHQIDRKDVKLAWP
jgi:hypothetical protein